MTDPTLPTTTTACVMGPPDHTHPADVGHLCDQHVGRLASWLLQVEDLALAVETTRTMRAAGDGRGGRLASQRTPLDEYALALMGPVATGKLTNPDGDDDTPHAPTVLASWAEMVREARGFPPFPPTLTVDRRLLSTQMLWIAEQPWVGDFADELHVLLSALRRALPHLAPRQRTITCWVVQPTDRGSGPCGGRVQRRTLWRTLTTVNGPANVQTDDGPWTCERCRSTWDPDDERVQLIVSQLEAEARRPRTGDGRPMLTAAEIADRFRVTPETVRKRASRLRIGARDMHYDPRALGWSEQPAPEGAAG